MNEQLSPDEMIEEGLLSGASTGDICSWLKERTMMEGTQRHDPFYNLRRIYEPLWLGWGNERLNLHLCLYGRDIENLRGIFWGEYPYHYKCAILKNNSFVSSCSSERYWSFAPGGICGEELNQLYEEHLGDKECRLFFRLFLNNSIPDHIILEMFRTHETVRVDGNFNGDKIARADKLSCVQLLLVKRDGGEGFFAHKRKGRTSNTSNYPSARGVACSVLGYIVKEAIGSEAIFNRDGSYKQIIIDLIEDFLKETSEDKCQLRSFNQNFLDNLSAFADTRSMIDTHALNQIIYIISEVGHRVVHTPETLEYLRSSPYKELRRVFYRNAPLYLIYRIARTSRTVNSIFRQFTIEKFHTFLEGGAEKVSMNADEISFWNEFKGHLDRDGIIFIEAIICNQRHYEQCMVEFMKYLSSLKWEYFYDGVLRQEEHVRLYPFKGLSEIAEENVDFTLKGNK